MALQTNTLRIYVHFTHTGLASFRVLMKKSIFSLIFAEPKDNLPTIE